MNAWFGRVSNKVAVATGSSWAFVLAILIVVVWVISGPLFGFSDTWQLVINTGTTIITFLMVFLIQNTQNRDTRALHLKLDELLRAMPDAREGEFMDLEMRDEAQLEAERTKLFAECNVCKTAEEHTSHGTKDWLRRHAGIV